MNIFTFQKVLRIATAIKNQVFSASTLFGLLLLFGYLPINTVTLILLFGIPITHGIANAILNKLTLAAEELYEEYYN